MPTTNFEAEVAEVDEPHMKYSSFGVFSPTNPARLAARSLLLQPWFDGFIYATICVNLFCVAFRDPLAATCEYTNDPGSNTTLRVLDIIFTTIYISEMLLKLLLFGLWQHPGAYLRDGWNWIDGFVSIVSLLGLLPVLCISVSGLSALRAARLLRAMKSVPSFGATRAIVQALIDATPKLVHVGSLLLFVFLCFAILGVQLFMGHARRRCHVLQSDGTLSQAVGLQGAYAPCSASGDGGNQCAAFAGLATLNGRKPQYATPPAKQWKELTCDHIDTSGYLTGDLFCCQPAPLPPNSPFYFNGEFDERTSNPDYGFTSFDNIGWAFIVVYRNMAIDDWPVSMQLMFDSGGGGGIIYALVLVLCCGWFTANLTLAVIYEQVHLENKRSQKFKAGLAAELAAHAKATEEATADAAEMETQIRKADAQLVHAVHAVEAEPKGGGLSEDSRTGGGLSEDSRSGGGLSEDSRSRCSRVSPFRGRKPPLRLANLDFTDDEAGGHTFTLATAVERRWSPAPNCCYYAGQPDPECVLLGGIELALTFIFLIEMLIKLLGLGVGGYVSDRFNIFDGFIVLVSVFSQIAVVASGRCSEGFSPSIFRSLRLIRLLQRLPIASLRELMCIITQPTLLASMGALFLIFLLCQYTFTLLGMSYFGNRFVRCQQCTPLPRPLELPLAVGSIPLNATLGIAWEPFPMLAGATPYALCDCHPVEGYCRASSAADYLTTQRNLPVGIEQGCLARVPLQNFDTFGDAFMTTFQLFTGEAWHPIMFLGMRSTNVATLLYFCLSVLIGRYILLNMYTAIILSFLVSANDDGRAKFMEAAKQAQVDVEEMASRLKLMGFDEGSTAETDEGLRMTPAEDEKERYSQGYSQGTL
ncbi:voltage-gated ion channel superfamily [Chrysochromulina tobinii]|uniref:Voltage-gated ion channel superfamily n=1 Tax=Chrysochromulina tobinii TaxID=1460289 RepID=A0A0M0JIQ7_9EUKA|nr:voltage-gated ion channel superfamily [Chrysochromulina tobinii]|eukprot:KOO26444.1 voltage-gated ion channel superfamily [Chrysochromulina sp. CCMP291]